MRSLTASSSGYSDEMTMTPLPASARSRIISRISLLVPMSTPAVGSSKINTSGSVPSHLASTTFCWLPPESSRTGRLGWATLTVNRLIRSSDERSALGLARQDAVLHLLEQRQQQVLPHRVVQHQALLAAVLRDQRETGGDGPLR